MHRLLYVLMIVALVPADVRAADWTAVKLRGPVFASTAVDGGQWVRLKRGDIVDAARVIRTLGGGNVEFQSGDETIAFGPGSQAEIVDRAGRRYTTVEQQAGSVAISAEALEVQHFSVETPYLVAVVKGTRFNVVTNAQGSSVSVARGLVAVTDRARNGQVLLPAGRSLVVDADGGTLLSGEAIPALVHPDINGVIEDATPAAGGVAAPADGGLAEILEDAGLGSMLGDLGPSLDSTVGGVVGTTDALTGTVGSTVSDVGTTVSGLGATTTALGTTLGSTVSGLGNSVGLGGSTGIGGSTGLGTVTGSVGNTVTTVTTTLGSTVSNVGGTVNSLGTSTGGTLGGVTHTVTGTVGGVLSHLGL